MFILETKQNKKFPLFFEHILSQSSFRTDDILGHEKRWAIVHIIFNDFDFVHRCAKFANENIRYPQYRCMGFTFVFEPEVSAS